MTDMTSAAAAAPINVSQNTEQQGKKSSTPWKSAGLTVGIIVCGILTIAGIALWAMQLSGGMI